MVALSVLGERQGQGGLEGSLLVNAVVLEDGAELGGAPWPLRATPARHPSRPLATPADHSPPQQTGVQPPALPPFSLTVMGPGHLVATSGGWSGCPEDTAPSDGGLDRLCAVAARNKSCPSPPRFQDGGVGEASTPVFLPSGPGAGGAEAGAYKAGCLQAGRGREEQAWGCTRRRASAGGMWLFPSGHWRGPSPRKVCPQASVQNRGDCTPVMAPPPEAPRVRRAGWPVGEGPTAQPRPPGPLVACKPAHYQHRRWGGARRVTHHESVIGELVPVEQVLQEVGALVAGVAPGHGRADGAHLGQSGDGEPTGPGRPCARGAGSRGWAGLPRGWGHCGGCPRSASPAPAGPGCGRHSKGKRRWTCWGRRWGGDGG